MSTSIFSALELEIRGLEIPFEKFIGNFLALSVYLTEPPKEEGLACKVFHYPRLYFFKVEGKAESWKNLRNFIQSLLDELVVVTPSNVPNKKQESFQ